MTCQRITQLNTSVKFVYIIIKSVSKVLGHPSQSQQLPHLSQNFWDWLYIRSKLQWRAIAHLDPTFCQGYAKLICLFHSDLCQTVFTKTDDFLCYQTYMMTEQAVPEGEDDVWRRAEWSQQLKRRHGTRIRFDSRSWAQWIPHDFFGSSKKHAFATWPYWSGSPSFRHLLSRTWEKHIQISHPALYVVSPWWNRLGFVQWA